MYCTVPLSLQVDGVKKLSLDVPAATAQDAEALEVLALKTALERELVHATPLCVETAPLGANSPQNRFVNLVTQ